MGTCRLTVEALEHDRRYAPVAIDLPDHLGPSASGRLTCRATGKAAPCQVGDGKLHFILERLDAGERAELTFDTDAKPARASRVALAVDEQACEIGIRVRRKAFATYRYSPQFARPHFYPLLGPDGVQITRHFPMRDDVPGETNDHKHHRSLWVAFGDVNGSDNWSEEPGHAWQVHQELLGVESGAVFGQFRQRLVWQDHDRQQNLEETRTTRIYQTPDRARLVDLAVELRAAAGEVRFGDTKEGGICSVRVATTMDGDKGGRIENSFGGIGEAETWGKPAHWCDYSGPVAGPDGQMKHVGIAVFDHPFNLRHPTPWHVRNYGLMTANPFGHSYYKSGLLQDGSYTLPAGETLTFRYRVYLHRHDARQGQVAQRYHDYVNPPPARAE